MRDFSEYGAIAVSEKMMETYELEMDTKLPSPHSASARKSSLSLQPTKLSAIKFWGEESSKLILS